MQEEGDRRKLEMAAREEAAKLHFDGVGGHVFSDIPFDEDDDENDEKDENHENHENHENDEKDEDYESSSSASSDDDGEFIDGGE